MIIGERKPLEEIRRMLAPYERVLVLGCGTCVTVCSAGGEKEVGVLAASLRLTSRLAGDPKMILEATVERQCEYEYNEQIADKLEQVDAVLSLACGIGVQTMNEQFPFIVTLPGINTTFLGQPVEQGVWAERCQACGDCVLDLTGGICPIARCAKSLLNGPCGGSQNGKCEVDSDVDCAWQLIYDRLKALDRLDALLEIQSPKDWSTSRDGGQREIVREDLRI
jgi:ferredoxin